MTRAKAKVSDLPALGRSLGFILSGSDYRTYVGRVSATAVNAIEVEKGAQEYIIRAKPGGWLVFPGTNGHTGNKTGKWAGLVVVKQVTHPPVAARHYLKDSLRETIR